MLGNKDDLSTLGDKLFFVLPAHRYSHHINTVWFCNSTEFDYFNFQRLPKENPHADSRRGDLADYCMNPTQKLRPIINMPVCWRTYFYFQNLPAVACILSFGYHTNCCEIISRNNRGNWETSQGGRVASSKVDRQKQLEARC